MARSVQSEALVVELAVTVELVIIAALAMIQLVNWVGEEVELELMENYDL